jgi:hypothetical protein
MDAEYLSKRAVNLPHNHIRPLDRSSDQLAREHIRCLFAKNVGYFNATRNGTKKNLAFMIFLSYNGGAEQI